MVDRSNFSCSRFRHELALWSRPQYQIGDLASFFLVVGIFTLCAAVKKNKVWLYTPIALLGFAAVSRLIAFVFHNAALSTDKILVELVLAGFLIFLVKRKENSFS
tara:strand:- start:90 stop:404 length:315 start_codon:yes stop_codon:yes gene_type:complete